MTVPIDIFENRRKNLDGKTHIPVWFMRQAGRYHQHYQNIKKDHDFATMCKNPDLAARVTLGPIDEFDFDAAILFSDLLFPLEYLGMGLSYANGSPTLAFHLESLADLKKLDTSLLTDDYFYFQKKALQILKERLPSHKTLLGFVGAPFTLYTYAVCGSHSGSLINAKKGLYQGLYQGFNEFLTPILLDNMRIQAEGGAQAICLFDTACGELCLSDYQDFIVEDIRKITAHFKKSFPDVKIIYYSKFTNLSYLKSLEDDNIDVLGVDWRIDLARALSEFSHKHYIQGNIDPAWPHLPWEKLKDRLENFFNTLKEADVDLNKWICGLGHGVLLDTPEENVRKSVELIHQKFII